MTKNFQSKLDGIAGLNSDYIRSLPAEVKKRVKALKVLQKKQMETEVGFHKEYHQLELKYQSQMAELATQVHFRFEYNFCRFFSATHH